MQHNNLLILKNYSLRNIPFDNKKIGYRKLGIQTWTHTSSIILRQYTDINKTFVKNYL